MNKFLFSIVIISSMSSSVFGQGCSDAGFCTMGAMKPDQPFNKKVPIKLRSMEISFYRGKTTLSPVVYVATADLSFNIIDSKTFFQVKLPYQAVDGNFGKTGSLGDISLCLTRNVFSSEKFDISVSLGGKIRSNDANTKSDQGLSYPMYYQTSLGTYDIITGISLVSKKWLFATGIQHPFNQTKNTFTYERWVPVYHNGEGQEFEDYVLSYAPCYQLKRGTDIMFRAERNFRYSRFNFTLGLLPIIRINKDEVTDPNTLQRVKLEGTTGMALTGIFTAGYSFDVKSGIRLLLGQKFTERKVNPDGLTRHNVSTISYYYRF